MSNRKELWDILDDATGEFPIISMEEAQEQLYANIMACVPEDMEMIPYQSNEDDIHTSAYNSALAEVRRNLKEYLGVKW